MLEKNLLTNVIVLEGKNYSSNKFFEISVLIPCWHCENTISGALDSIENQKSLPKRLNLEVILIIDGREQDYIAVKKWLQNKNNLQRWNYKIVHLKYNNGAGKARKIGYEFCEGKYITFLDDDDIWHPEKIYFQWQWHLRNPKYILSVHGYESSPNEKDIKLFNLLIGIDKIATPSIMIKRKLWPYEPEPYRYGEDWLMLAMASTICPIKLLSKNFAWRSKNALPFYLDSYSLSRNRINLRIGKLLSIIRLIYRKKLNIIWIIPLFLLNILFFIRRLLLDILLLCNYFYKRFKSIIKKF